MQEVEVLQKADSDAASDDSEPPEAVELTPEVNAPVYSTCGSTAAPCSTSAQHDADALSPAPVTIITGFLGAGASWQPLASHSATITIASGCHKMAMTDVSGRSSNAACTLQAKPHWCTTY